MAIASPPTDFTGIMGNLAALSGQQEQNKQQAIKTKEFLDTHNNRVKAENADLALQTQQKEMGLEVAKTEQEEGRHQDKARAADEAAVAKSEQEESKAELGKKHYDLGSVTDEASRKRAILEALDDNIPIPEIESNLGPLDRTWDEVKEFIDVRKDKIARSLEAQSAIAAEASDYKAELGLEGSKAQAFATLAAARMRAEAMEASARAAAVQSPYGVVDPKDFPTYPPEYFIEDIKNHHGFGLIKGKTHGATIVAQSQKAAGDLNALIQSAYFSWNDLVATRARQGLSPPPMELHPSRQFEKLKAQALQGAMGDVTAPAVGPYISETDQALIKEQLRDPTSPLSIEVQRNYGQLSVGQIFEQLRVETGK